MPTYDSVFVCLDHVCNLLWGLLWKVIVCFGGFQVSLSGSWSISHCPYSQATRKLLPELDIMFPKLET